jgi:hypothetical protein
MLIIVLDNVKLEKEKTKRALIFSDIFSIFVVVRSDHNEGLGKISFRSVFLFFGGRKKKEDTRKKKFLPFACRNVGRRSLGICSQAFYRTFACAVIYTNHHTGLELRF